MLLQSTIWFPFELLHKQCTHVSYRKHSNSVDNKYVAGVFVDLKKVFDTVEHDILIEKLSHCVRGVAKDWFISYLKRRRQFVVIENETSSTQEILTGVPQGSVLGDTSVI